MNRLRVGLVFGGRSFEHEVSIASAVNVAKAICQKRYVTVPLFIDPKGHWYKCSSMESFKEHLAPLQLSDLSSCIDVAFPLVHGPYGEDGCLQGLLKMLQIPFVGCGVLSSAVCMDKDVCKRLLQAADLPVVPFFTLEKKRAPICSYETCSEFLGSTFFVKPANAGSSVGISKVKNAQSFLPALEEAFSYDTKLILEEAAEGREIECAVFGVDTIQVSRPGEIISHHEFYSYEAKYVDELGYTIEVPARLSEDMEEKIQRFSLRAYEVLGCTGMARVDFFLKQDQTLWINEVNTLPGFTDISMYPMMWEASGVPYQDLITSLIESAFEVFTREESLAKVYSSTQKSRL